MAQSMNCKKPSKHKVISYKDTTAISLSLQIFVSLIVLAAVVPVSHYCLASSPSYDFHVELEKSLNALSDEWAQDVVDEVVETIVCNINRRGVTPTPSQIKDICKGIRHKSFYGHVIKDWHHPLVKKSHQQFFAYIVEEYLTLGPKDTASSREAHNQVVGLVQEWSHDLTAGHPQLAQKIKETTNSILTGLEELRENPLIRLYAKPADREMLDRAHGSWKDVLKKFSVNPNSKDFQQKRAIRKILREPLKKLLHVMEEERLSLTPELKQIYAEVNVQSTHISEWQRLMREKKIHKKMYRKDFLSAVQEIIPSPQAYLDSTIAALDGSVFEPTVIDTEPSKAVDESVSDTSINSDAINNTAIPKQHPVAQQQQPAAQPSSQRRMLPLLLVGMVVLIFAVGMVFRQRKNG